MLGMTVGAIVEMQNKNLSCISKLDAYDSVLQAYGL